MDNIENMLLHLKMEQICEQNPVIHDYLSNYNLTIENTSMTLQEYIHNLDLSSLEEFGLTAETLLEQMCNFIDTIIAEQNEIIKVKTLTILGGHNKSLEQESVKLELSKGDVVSIVGPTGSGKSRLLEDIECIAQNDTPTGRCILINGQRMDDLTRFEITGKLIAQLSQNMNFVMDLTVGEFLRMHAQSRLWKDVEKITEKCFLCANSLAGEKFTIETKVTQLSGGQSRALMIADTAYISSSPIVLIDEIENAGVDRKKAISILSNHEKIILISTHDPLLALSANKRIVIKNGGIKKIIETDEQEQKSLAKIEKLDNMIMNLRQSLREGKNINLIGDEDIVGVI